jgi:hypothetical protein
MRYQRVYSEIVKANKALTRLVPQISIRNVA